MLWGKAEGSFMSMLRKMPPLRQNIPTTRLLSDQGSRSQPASDCRGKLFDDRRFITACCCWCRVSVCAAIIIIPPAQPGSQRSYITCRCQGPPPHATKNTNTTEAKRSLVFAVAPRAVYKITSQHMMDVQQLPSALTTV